MERELEVERERGKQLDKEIARLEEENAELKGNETARMKGMKLEVKATVFNSFPDCILDFKRKGGNDPNSPFHDKIRNLITKLEEDSTKYGLDEEDVTKLKDFAVLDTTVLQSIEESGVDKQPLAPGEQEEEEVGIQEVEEVGIHELEDPAIVNTAVLEKEGN